MSHQPERSTRAVCGVAYVQAGFVPAIAMWASLPVSVLVAVGLAWAGVGGGLNAPLIVVAVIGVLVILYYNRSIGRLAHAFYGVKDAVAKT